MFNEVQLIRRQAQRGVYEQAIAAAREAARRERELAAGSGDANETAASDASPELADAARRI
jgi:hypothetical protein